MVANQELLATIWSPCEESLPENEANTAEGRSEKWKLSPDNVSRFEFLDPALTEAISLGNFAVTSFCLSYYELGFLFLTKVKTRTSLNSIALLSVRDPYRLPTMELE